MSFLNYYYLTESLADYLPQFFDFLKQQPDDTVVHFSNWFRVGFNPRPTHQDPIGIYTFPKKYVLSPQFKNNSHFFGMNNAFILKIKPGFRTLNLSTVSMPEVQRLAKVMGLVEGDPTGHHSLKKLDIQAKPGHILWDSLEKTLEKMKISGAQKNLQWNRFFKKAGIDILIDNGDSIIHSNEPYQVVFLTPGSYKQVTYFQHSVDKIYKQLAIRVIKMVGLKLFDSEPRLSSHKRYSDTEIYAHGNYKGKPIIVWTTAYGKETKKLDQTLRITLHLSSHLTDKYSPDTSKEERSVEVSFDAEHPDVETQVDKVIKSFKSQLEEGDYFREDKTPYVKKLTETSVRMLGLGGKVERDRDREEWNYKKNYKDFGVFSIRGYYSGYGKTYHLYLSLKQKDMTLYGYDKAELPAEQVEANPETAARELVIKNLDYWDEIQERLYPIDPDKYPANDWRSYEKIALGKKWKQFINFIRNKIRQTT